MYNNKKILAIIPARGGSKGLPGKNIKPLCGKPLIGWSIEQAQASEYIDEIFVSTDSSEIAAVAESFGVKVPFLRPSELATDTSPSSAFVLHTINYYRSKGHEFDYILLLEPTSPLRKKGDIDEVKFKEILLKNPEVARTYEKLKLKLEIKYKYDRESYTNGKTELINKIKKDYGLHK